MQISVEGRRSSVSDWQAISEIPADRLRPLTPGQAAVAAELKIPAEDYARGIMEGDRASEALLEKTQRLARLLKQRFSSQSAGVQIDSVALETWAGKFRVAIRGTINTVFRINEDLVDDLFEGGSKEADERISRVIDLVVGERVA
jgi:hypothetical protein